MVNTYTRGLLGVDQQDRVEQQVSAANAVRADWTIPLATLGADEIRADRVLMAHVARTAPALFGDNCAACHGSNAAGGPGFPSLVDAAWLWSGDADTIMETLRVGINSPHPDTRYAQMLAFGEMDILSRAEIRTVIDYVQSLSGLETQAGADRLAEGATLFEENCASCHGENAMGVQDIGAPNLTDASWIYGGDDASMFETIYAGRQGWMPAWEDRLTRADRMMLTLYIQDLAQETNDAD